MRVYGAWHMIYYVLCSITYRNISCLFWSPDGSRRATKVARICEICLLKYTLFNKQIMALERLFIHKYG